MIGSLVVGRVVGCVFVEAFEEIRSAVYHIHLIPVTSIIIIFFIVQLLAHSYSSWPISQILT
jgi:hypothetical protein